MRLRHIEIFHAVFMTGSVSGAAKSLNVSQPTVSKILRHAEDQLGFDLFYREKGRIFPTEKANLLFAQITPVYEQLNDLKKYTVMLKSTNVGRLRIAMTPAFSLQAVPKALAAFNAKHPDIPIEIETQHASEISRLIHNNTIDLGVVFEAIEQPGLEIKQLGTTEFVCVSPANKDVKSNSIDLESLSALPLIQLNAKSPLGHMLNMKLEALGLFPNGSTIVAETYHLAKRLVEQGTGVAVIDKITAYSGNITDIIFHDLKGLDPIKIDVVSRSNDPLISFKKDFLEILRVELKRYGTKE